MDRFAADMVASEHAFFFGTKTPNGNARWFVERVNLKFYPDAAELLSRFFQLLHYSGGIGTDRRCARL
jgi:hypothetical protein